MVDRSALVAGKHYFYLTYEDPDLRIPLIETLKYVGVSNEAMDGVPFHVFERIGAACSPKQCRLTSDLLMCLHEFSGLVDELTDNRKAWEAGVPFD